jgi:tetratricopeptide (TPR) repeat protein
MESLEKFAAENNFSKTVEYHDKAKEYINKAVAELSKNIGRSKSSKEITYEKSEYDEFAANDKYMECLGKYYEAERSWELALRLSPNHKKSKIALRKLKSFLKE